MSTGAADQMRAIADAMRTQISLTESGTQVNNAYYARLQWWLQWIKLITG